MAGGMKKNGSAHSFISTTPDVNWLDWEPTCLHQSIPILRQKVGLGFIVQGKRLLNTTTRTFTWGNL
ncbi:hypothetical protein Pcinc_031751 [Petrolisthes cinctipes]|uniref:Uncharacterized protein n=1 Tax=Petrolisthes cinctipes TaxID=88211 RepID=A0AAE1EWC8_PETCI|nr:hypothetical protein Pcinc_031751 [Petrolisthes cinctipes]